MKLEQINSYGQESGHAETKQIASARGKESKE
jgi:hypothetical protein